MMYKEFVRKIDAFARQDFEAYQKAEAELKKATEAMKPFNRGGFDQIEALNAKAKMLAAKKIKDEALANMKARNTEIEAMRRELLAKIDEKYSADPAQIDRATMDLIASGILRPSEYDRLMSKAEASGNHTMQRLIAKAAKDASQKHPENSKEAKELRAVSYRAKTGSTDLALFDSVADVYKRTSNNPAMISAWGELIGPIVGEDGEEDE